MKSIKIQLTDSQLEILYICDIIKMYDKNIYKLNRTYYIETKEPNIFNVYDEEDIINYGLNKVAQDE